MIEEYVNRNYNKNISLRDPAKVLHLCEKQTARIVRREFGMGFVGLWQKSDAVRRYTSLPIRI